MPWLYFLPAGLGFFKMYPSNFQVGFSQFPVILVAYTYETIPTLEYPCTICQGASPDLKSIGNFPQPA